MKMPCDSTDPQYEGLASALSDGVERTFLQLRQIVFSCACRSSMGHACICSDDDLTALENVDVDVRSRMRRRGQNIAPASLVRSLRGDVRCVRNGEMRLRAMMQARITPFDVDDMRPVWSSYLDDVLKACDECEAALNDA